MFPIATFEPIELARFNDRLVQWGHKMGPLLRGNSSALHCHALCVNCDPVAIASTSSLIREHVGGGLSHLDRSNTIELSRVCASNPWACRVILRLWRELVFPALGYRYAISYQDAIEHSGNLYRFDGWKRMGYSSSGTDSRSGRKGRRKWIWVWESQIREDLAA
jgi:hypothetical protein